MKKFWIIMLGVIAVGIVSCNKVRRNPGRVYMPDMAYSRAYETYASTEELQKKGIRYTGMPVPGTIARGDLPYIYTLPNDTTGYARSSGVKNPLKTDSIMYEMKEAERLYQVNCAICHGTKLDGNGPLWNNGNGPYPAAPRNLLEPAIVALSDGTYFHVITYGKNLMGSYASQLSTVQRWMVIDYMRSKQGMASDTTSKAPVADTTSAVR